MAVSALDGHSLFSAIPIWASAPGHHCVRSFSLSLRGLDGPAGLEIARPPGEIVRTLPFPQIHKLQHRTPSARRPPSQDKWTMSALNILVELQRHGFEYKRNGTLSLYAALNTQTGQVQGKTTAHHTSQDFVEFLGEVVAGCQPEQEIHIILDNLSAHKTRKVAEFLEQHPNVALHFTPTYSSWLNQVELWFSKLQRDVIARGVFTSTADLARKLRRYINAYSKNAEPFRWKYSQPSRRIRHG